MRKYNVALVFVALLAGCLLSPFVLLDSGAQVSSSTARRIFNVTADPASCANGDVRNRTDTNTLRLCNDGAWATVGGGTTINSTDGAIPYRSSSTAFGNSPLLRVDANTLAQANTTSAQKHHFYATVDNASSPTNYERFTVDTNPVAGRVYLTYTKGGTGGNRDIWLFNQAGNIRIDPGSSGTLTFSNFGTPRWDMNSSGHLLASTDNSVDIGASGATRPRNIYAGTNVFTADDAFASGWDGSSAVPTKNAVYDKINAGEQLLASGTVNMNSTTAQDLYTVPAGKTLVITKAVTRSPSIVLAGCDSTQARVITSADGSTILTMTTETLDSTSKYSMSTATIALTITATNKAQVRPDIACGVAATATIDLFGYLF